MTTSDFFWFVCLPVFGACLLWLVSRYGDVDFHAKWQKWSIKFRGRR